MSDEAPKRGRGRPRRAGADEEILRVSLELLREYGYRAFTVDLVSERTGIAKTTIYRRWPTKGALVAAAIAPLESAGGMPEQVLEETAEVLRLLDAEAVEALRAVLTPRRAQLAAAVGDRRADELLGALVLDVLMR